MNVSNRPELQEILKGVIQREGNDIHQKLGST